MIPSNPFGGSRGGQPTSDSQLPSFGFYQAPAFEQFSSQGNAFFGQPTIPVTSVPGGNQATAFNQPSSQAVSTVFGQTTARKTSSVFGLLPSFGVSPGFGKQLQDSSQQPSNLGTSSESFDSTSSLGPSEPLGFGRTVFGHPSSTSVTTSVFSSSSSGAENKGFTSSNFSFKPVGESLFKPIFGAGPDPQTSSMPDSPFSMSESQTSSSTLNSDSASTNFFSLPGAKSRPADFNFSQPSSALSVTAQNNPLTTGSSSTNTVQFTFSQPLPLSSSSGLPSTSQPTTPSSFSFSIKPSKPQKTTIFKGTSFDQPLLFGDTKIHADASGDEKGQNLENANIFTAFSRGTKRKEGTVVSSAGLEKSITNEGVPAEADSTAHLTKRPHVRLRGPLGGIFGRAVNDLCKDANNAGGFQATKGAQQQLTVRETQKDQVQGQTNSPPAIVPEDPAQQSMDQLQKSEESDSRSSLDPDTETKTPLNYSGSPTDCHIILCKNVPTNLNKKDILEKHFGRFGKVRKVFCRPAKNMATVHFNDHASAAQAKKKGKVLHNKELLLLWQRKKQSPSEKWSRPAAGTEETKGESEADSKSKASSSPYKRTLFSASPVRSTATLSHSMPVKRSSMVKSLQFNTEPQKENITESQSLECPVPSSISYLIGQVAETAEEKYRLLEQRDKVLRQSRPKRTDLDMSKVFVGTCPDMCPEKERFMRETRKQLSVFEVIPDTEMVDHSAAVKEYSRSSADQEEPLPHELRPLPVLCMTMDYLVTQIIDQVHENCRDWYDFVWNRTRGIRKDITQQHLCCPDTVSLIEKCTRFHVHCAHHLCEEHISAFDAKINNENMTKCLQSLKEMYQDMAMQQVYCSREAEFRQYSVLLRLNDGDILREVQQFRAEVRNSPEVKLAVQAFAAVNSNNFVRFFKLVKRASYLVSCLLHRYFNQVRAKALQTLNLAHTVGPRSTAFPLEDIVRMLMFNSPEEAIDFIQHHGLIINDGVVEMSRTNYQQPDLPLSPKKSDIILAKKPALVGEVVNGGRLPTPPQHIPVCSFDSQNKYRGEVLAAEPTTVQLKATDPELEVKIADTPAAFGQSAGITNQTAELREPYHSLDQSTDSQQLFLPISQPQPVKPPSPEPVYHTEDLTSVLDCVIEEVVADAVTEVACAGVSYATTALAESIVHVESVLSEVLGQTLQEISSDEMEKERLRVEEEKRKLEEARRKQEHEAFLINFSHSLCTTLVHEVLDETLKDIAISEIEKAVDEKAECVARCTEQICTTIVEETLNADVTALVEAILEAKLQCIQKYISRWRNVVALRQQLKRQMRVFPAAPCFVDPLRKQKALVPSAPMEPCMEKLAHGVVDLGNAGNLAISSTSLLKLRKEVLKQMRVHFYYQQLLDEAVWLPLNLPQLVVENSSKPGDQIFWKAVLFLPSYHDSVSNLSDRILSEWLETKFGGGQEPSDGTLRTIHFTNTIQEKEQCLHRVHISIKALRGPLSEQGMSKMESFEFQGTRVLIMLLPSTSINETEENDPDVPLLSALLQLKQFQQASTCHCPLPLVILVPGSDTGITQKLEEALVLQELVQEDFLSEYKFFFIPESSCDLQGCRQLEQVMSWLVAHTPPAIPLSCQTLQQLVEATLNHEFISRVYIEHQKRITAQLPSVHPSPVISLYNAVLTHIADNITSQEMETLPPCEFWQPENPEFVPYLGWNFVHHQAWIRKAILSLQLPQWESLSATDSWTELCTSIFGYAAQVPLTGHSQLLLMSRLKNLLERVRVKGKIIPGTVCSGFTEIPWDNIVLVCMDQKLRDWQIPGPPVYEDALTDNGDILVYFHAESLNGFKPPEEWTQVVRQTLKEKRQESQEMDSVACAIPSRLSFGQEAFHSLGKPEETCIASLDTHTPTAQEMLGQRVLQSFDEERRESQRCTDQFQQWLDSDPLDHISTLFLPSHTLVSTPLSTTYTPAAKTQDATIA